MSYFVAFDHNLFIMDNQVKGKHRNWIFTLNNYTDADIAAIVLWVCRYLIFGRESAPTTGTKHLQGYVSFEDQKTLSVLKKKFHGKASFRPARGSPEENKVYCSKEDPDFFEKGTPPVWDPVAKGTLEKDRWAEAFQAVKRKAYDEVPMDLLCTKLKCIEYAVQRVTASKWDLSTIPGGKPHKWIYGHPGCGKSRSVREQYPDAYVKDPRTPWWDGYNGEEVVIIDDYDKYQVDQSGDMKRWLDLYAVRVQVKGGYMLIRPRLIIVTSQYTMEECFEKDPKTLEAMKRRCEITHIVYDLYPSSRVVSGAVAERAPLPANTSLPNIEVRTPDPAGAERHAGGAAEERSDDNHNPRGSPGRLEFVLAAGW